MKRTYLLSALLALILLNVAAATPSMYAHIKYPVGDRATVEVSVYMDRGVSGKTYLKLMSTSREKTWVIPLGDKVFRRGLNVFTATFPVPSENDNYVVQVVVEGRVLGAFLLNLSVPITVEALPEYIILYAPKQMGGQRVEIYDLSGRRVADVVLTPPKTEVKIVPGNYLLKFNGKTFARVVVPAENYGMMTTVFIIGIFVVLPLTAAGVFLRKRRQRIKRYIVVELPDEEEGLGDETSLITASEQFYLNVIETLQKEMCYSCAVDVEKLKGFLDSYFGADVTYRSVFASIFKLAERGRVDTLLIYSPTYGRETMYVARRMGEGGVLHKALMTETIRALRRNGFMAEMIPFEKMPAPDLLVLRPRGEAMELFVVEVETGSVRASMGGEGFVQNLVRRCEDMLSLAYNATGGKKKGVVVRGVIVVVPDDEKKRVYERSFRNFLEKVRGRTWIRGVDNVYVETYTRLDGLLQNL